MAKKNRNLMNPFPAVKPVSVLPPVQPKITPLNSNSFIIPNGTIVAPTINTLLSGLPSGGPAGWPVPGAINPMPPPPEPVDEGNDVVRVGGNGPAKNINMALRKRKVVNEIASQMVVNWRLGAG